MPPRNIAISRAANGARGGCYAALGGLSEGDCSKGIRRSSGTARQDMVTGMTNNDAAVDVTPGLEQAAEAQQETFVPSLS